VRLVIRPMVQGDWPFVFATYLRSNWFSKGNRTTLKRSTWSKLHHNRLEGLIGQPGAYTACLDDDQDLILGYGFMDGELPYVYVKLAFRGPGLKVHELLHKIVKENNK
jgi:hypothetical protein